MPTTQVQLRRDTSTNLNAATPADGEPAYNTTDDRLHMGDGATSGGIPHVNFKDLQNGTFIQASSVGGTANAITLTLTPGIAAYGDRKWIRFKAASTNSGAVTVNVNSIGTRDIRIYKDAALTALSGNEIVGGGVYDLVDDGTRFILLNPSQVTASAGGLVWLANYTANSASVNITSVINATYDEYLIRLVNVVTSNNELWIRTSTNNGSSWDSGGSDYRLSSAGSASGQIEVSFGTAVSEGITGDIILTNVNNTTRYKHLLIDLSGASATITVAYKGSATRRSASDIDAVQLLTNSGTFSSGTVRVYGYKKS